jgi:hypothetical protein
MIKYKDYLNGYAVRNRGQYLFTFFTQLRKDLVTQVERDLATRQAMTWPEIRKENGVEIVRARIVVAGSDQEQIDALYNLAKAAETILTRFDGIASAEVETLKRRIKEAREAISNSAV